MDRVSLTHLQASLNSPTMSTNPSGFDFCERAKRVARVSVESGRAAAPLRGTKTHFCRSAAHRRVRRANEWLVIGHGFRHGHAQRAFEARPVLIVVLHSLHSFLTWRTKRKRNDLAWVLIKPSQLLSFHITSFRSPAGSCRFAPRSASRPRSCSARRTVPSALTYQ